MDVRMGSEDGLVVGSPEQMCGQFQSELMMQLPVWRERLSQQLGSFRELEEQIRLFYGRGGAMLAAGLLAEASRLPATQEAVAKLQEQAVVPLRPPERRSRRIQLWGGLMFWITTLYGGPRERTGQGRGKQGAGLYAELAAFGFEFREKGSGLFCRNGPKGAWLKRVLTPFRERPDGNGATGGCVTTSPVLDTGQVCRYSWVKTSPLLCHHPGRLP